MKIDIETISAVVSPHCTVSEVLSLIFQKLKRSRDLKHMNSVFYHACRIVHLHSSLSVHMDTKFEVPSFTNSKYIIGRQNLKMGHVTQITPINGV